MNVAKKLDSREEQIEFIQKTEWPFHADRFYIEYHKGDIDQIYLTMQLLGRYSAWCDLFPEDFNMDSFSDYFKYEPWMYHLFGFLREHETLDLMHCAYEEMKEVLSENWADMKNYFGK